MPHTIPRWFVGQRFALIAALAAAAFGLFYGLGHPGLMEPFEVGCAERARDSSEAAPGASDSGPLAWRVMAFGLRWFGTSAWGIRVPIACIAFAGILALAWLLEAALGRRAAVVGVLVLAVTPAYFVEGRHAFGDVTSMTAFALAVTGLYLAFVHLPALPESRSGSRAHEVRRRAVSALIGISGLAAGLASRGALFGVAMPCAVVLASFMTRAPSAALGPKSRRYVGFTLVTVMALSLAAFAFAVHRTAPGSFDAIVGARLSNGSAGVPSFESVIAEIGRNTFPMGIFACPALFVVAARRIRDDGEESEGIDAFRALVVVGTAISVGVHSVAAHWLGVPAFGVPFLIAVAIAFAFHELERDGRSYPAVAWVTVALAILFVTNGRDLPWTTVAPLHVARGAVESLAAKAARFSWAWTASGVLSGAAGALLVFGVDSFGDRARWRAWVVAACLVLSGTVVRFGHYPAWVARFSPAESLAEVESFRKGDEALATMGVSAASTHFSRTIVDERLPDVARASAWLESPDARRWLAFDVNALPELNAAHRSLRDANLPVVLGAGTQVLIATNQLPLGLASSNPLDTVVLQSRPIPSHRVAADLALGSADPPDVALTALGWDIVDDSGRARRSLPLRGSARIRIFYEVKRTGLEGHCTFIHVDGTPFRFAAENRDWSAYPMKLWRKGDVIVDSFDVVLPSQFRKGTSPLYFGLGTLPCSDDRRMHVVSGPTDGSDRIRGGLVSVE